MKILQKTQWFTGYQGLKTPNLHPQIALILTKDKEHDLFYLYFQYKKTCYC